MSSNTNLAETAIFARIKGKLNQEKVKLWEDPYFDEEKKVPSDAAILSLAEEYAREFSLPVAEVSDCLYHLQRNSIERIAERDQFQATGKATVRLRFSGFKPDLVSPDKVASISKLQVELETMTGRDLKSVIAAEISVIERALKIISAGKVVDEEKTLSSQGIKNGAQVMVLSVASEDDIASVQETDDFIKELKETKESAQYLAEKQMRGDNPYSLQLTDQNGRSLQLPPEEKKALTVALALHEKGKAQLKEQKHSKALVFLLEADTMYSRCASGILQMVDNYGLLNLDIAWCYLSLQSISELPQVEARLEACEKALKRSYGESMERVIALKGFAGFEASLYVRLHLLQGIASYHVGRIEKAKFLIGQAESELSRLKVSDDSLAQLIGMGYTAEESRIALRSTYGHLDGAVEWILRKREEKAQIKAQEKEENRLRKLQKKLGKCDNGDDVSILLFEQLKEMGCNKLLIPEALRRCNNDVNSALIKMADPQFELEVLQKLVDRVQNNASTSGNAEGEEGDPRAALNSVIANIQEMAASLPPTEGGSSFNPTTEENAGAQLSQALSLIGSADPNALQSALNSVKSALSETMNNQVSPTISEEEIQKSQKAYDHLAKDIHSEADYIDLSMGPESFYLEQYKALLETI